MKRFLLILTLALLTLSGCKEKRYFTQVSGKVWLSHLVFEDGSSHDFTVVTDVQYAGTDPYAGSDTSSRYKLIFYMPDGWDDSYPIFLDRYFPDDLPDDKPWLAYTTAYTMTDTVVVNMAEEALRANTNIVVLVPYEEGSAIPDILLAEEILKKYDKDLPGDSRKILTAAYYDFDGPVAY